jgi:hypothetical protein
MWDDSKFKKILSWPEFADVKAELEDPDWLTFTHGLHSTANEGCTGPLCRWARREMKFNQRKKKLGDSYQPIRRKTGRDPILEYLAECHRYDRLSREIEGKKVRTA